MAIEPFDCFAIAAPGLESIVARELTALGERPRTEDGGASWTGDARSMMRANLMLRTASRVLVRVARFKATAFYELEKRAKRVEWSRFVLPGAAVEFRVTSRKSKLYHSDAIAERLEKASGRPVGPGKGEGEGKGDGQLFVVRVLHDEVTISADTSGSLLHMRGYRAAAGKAPIRETLAAALLLAAEWSGSVALLDPFCGAGTIPIEAALIARRMAPGARRRFAFMAWPEFDRPRWEELQAVASTGVLASSPVPIVGSDRDAGAIDMSRANAERAGVAADIELSTRALSAAESPARTGLLATNPPYGVRVGKRDHLRDLYARLGQVVRDRFADWKVAMIAADPRMARETGLGFRELFRSANGGIPVRAVLAE